MPAPAAAPVDLLADLLTRPPRTPLLAMVYDPESPEDGELRMQGLCRLVDLPPVLYLGAEAVASLGGAERLRAASVHSVTACAGGLILRTRSAVSGPPTRPERQRLRLLRRYLGISSATPLRLAAEGRGRPAPPRWRLQRQWVEGLAPDRALTGVWCESPAAGWAVGEAGVALRWDGSAWSPLPAPTRLALSAVWAAPLDQPETAVAVGEAGTVLRWDGGAWATDPAPTRQWLRAVWGSGPDDVWAVGDGGTVLHGDGRSWRPVDARLDGSLLGVWGSGPDDVWAVGAGGVATHWDGVRWAPSSSGTGTDLCGVWTDVTGEAWAVGRDGLALRLAGGSWRPVPAGTDVDLHAVWGGPGGVWAVGDELTIRRWDGQALSVPPGDLAADGDGERLLSVHGDKRGRVWIVGEEACLLSLDPGGDVPA